MNGTYIVANSNSAIGASSWVDIEIITPSSTMNCYIEEIYLFNKAGIGQFVLYEAPSTIVTNTTTLTGMNVLRGSTNTLGSLLYSAPTLVVSTTATSSQATLIENFYLPAAREIEIENEYKLKSATTYILRMLNSGTSADYGCIRIQLSEKLDQGL